MIIPRLQNRFPRNNSTRRLRAFLLGLFAASMTALPLKAAEEIEFVYTPLVFSVSVASLETFAKEGKIDANLKRFLARATPEAREQKRLYSEDSVPPIPSTISRVNRNGGGRGFGSLPKIKPKSM